MVTVTFISWPISTGARCNDTHRRIAHFDWRIPSLTFVDIFSNFLWCISFVLIDKRSYSSSSQVFSISCGSCIATFGYTVISATITQKSFLRSRCVLDITVSLPLEIWFGRLKVCHNHMWRLFCCVCCGVNVLYESCKEVNDIKRGFTLLSCDTDICDSVLTLFWGWLSS